ncbi:ATP-dependent DNA ligase [Rhodococcus sp. HM1]|uniref:ATP-dependent DNA ligase n=1 Tax=unclassified Rhodococcus (in: high G+C Gram-positive bacteria) TaxID=192944 RepID=UPI0018CD9F42|nr:MULTISPECIES: ATP-dependent DNA ligase [unclassified Rhodococcus (in: high G+C Gram-positive bacteria)]MBH0123475.1 ATP-dependent DNA ligase [Rhodococcus sp. CX]MCK8670446.1 ATP-dependent DNA ligase [Rhodococcus sp. HM1]
MDLPVAPPLAPMLAKAVSEVPSQPSDGPAEWSYEPKWDGFRALVFRDGDEVVFASRGGKDLARYFPELVDAVRAELPRRCVVDGEIVVPFERDGRTRLDWQSLSERIHPAASRIALLAEQTPAQFVGFDLVAIGDENLMDTPFRDRRTRLQEIAGDGPSCHVTVATSDAATAQRWFEEFEGAGLDGVVAKRLDGLYVPDKREMVKVKHSRTADCVLAGYRKHKSIEGVGSLLLGLYHDGELVMVGGASAFTVQRRQELLAELEPLRVGADVVAEGEPTRWRSAIDRSWVPLRPERVLEVAYDQMEGSVEGGVRFRHAARFLRWRPDRDPKSCTYDQLEVPVRYDLADVLDRSES